MLSNICPFECKKITTISSPLFHLKACRESRIGSTTTIQCRSCITLDHVQDLKKDVRYIENLPNMDIENIQDLKEEVIQDLVVPKILHPRILTMS